MKYKVVRGFVVREGVIHRVGSFFDAGPDDVKKELRKGIIFPDDSEAEPEKKRGRRDL